MNLNPIQYPIPIPRWGIKIDILAKLWANPILNPSSRDPHIRKLFCWWTYMLDEHGPNPIPNSNSEVGHQNPHTGQPMGQSNTKFQFKGHLYQKMILLIDLHVRWTWTQSNTQFQFRVSKPTYWPSFKLRANPIPNPNSRDPHIGKLFVYGNTCSMNIDPIQYLIPIPPYEKMILLIDIHLRWTWTQSNTQFQFRGGGSK